jgi:MFS family permease
LETTDSPVLLGVVQALRFAPSGFGAFLGIAADRIDRRKLLFILSTIDIMLALLIGILVTGNQIQFWQIATITFLVSSTGTFSGPIRQVYTMDIVGKENITNAVALNQLSMRMASIVGSSLIGAFIQRLGIGQFFYFISIVYSIASISIWLIHLKTKFQPAGEKSVLNDLREGLKYVWNDKIILGIQLIAFTANLFPCPCNFTLMPVYARNILQVDAAGFGWLKTAEFASTLLVTIGIASFGNLRKKGYLLIVSSFLEGIFWALLSTSPPYFLSMIYFVSARITHTIFMMLIGTLLLIHSTPEMRDRVMGVRSLMVFPQSAGSLIAGELAQRIGISPTLFIEGILFSISIVGVVFCLAASLRKTD